MKTDICKEGTPFFHFFTFPSSQVYACSFQRIRGFYYVNALYKFAFDVDISFRLFFRILYGDEGIKVGLRPLLFTPSSQHRRFGAP